MRVLLTIVNARVRPLIRVFDLVLQLRWEKVNLCKLPWQQMIKFIIKLPNDLFTLIAHNSFLLLIVEDRDGESTVIVGLALKVCISQMREVWMKGIGDHVFFWVGFFGGCESPALGSKVPVDDCECDDVF